ncbi:response regulator [Oceanobacter kriegii]|uniref:response regulator n=1 Tax=Oceanobacter kriegii TaxID=64972 RepID=UPI00041A1821|nr:response regulator [Oceanobacter kriegii]
MIYVVDDSKTMLMSVRSTLEMAGYRVETCDNPLNAVQHLNGNKVDLIITDVNMPGMNGLELIAKVRSSSANRFTPILTLTTESQAQKRDEAKKLGATGWLVKPVSAQDLTRVLRQILPGA